jgi:hypothetical protein
MFHYGGCTKGIKIKAILEYLDECKLNCGLIDHITTARINSSTKSRKRNSKWTKISSTISSSSSSSSIKELTILTTTTDLTTTSKSYMKTVETFIEKTSFFYKPIQTTKRKIISSTTSKSITLTKNHIEESCSMDVFKDIININITN